MAEKILMAIFAGVVIGLIAGYFGHCVNVVYGTQWVVREIVGWGALIGAAVSYLVL